MSSDPSAIGRCWGVGAEERCGVLVGHPVGSAFEHAVGQVGSHDQGVGKRRTETFGELARTAPEVEHVIRFEAVESIEHGIVDRPVRGPLEAGSVVGGRPEVEED